LLCQFTPISPSEFFSIELPPPGLPSRSNKQ